jgi:hypothetical protein
VDPDLILLPLARQPSKLSVEGQDLLAKVHFKPAESSAQVFGLAAIGVRRRQEIIP